MTEPAKLKSLKIFIKIDSSAILTSRIQLWFVIFFDQKDINRERNVCSTPETKNELDPMSRV
jgi:hypothetical protein